MNCSLACRVFIFLVLSLVIFSRSYSQCCAGGSGCTIAGSAAQGVLQERQIELSSNFQFIHTNTFYKKDRRASTAERTFDGFRSSYQYFKVGYGITHRLTLSLETGYYFGKKETGLADNPLTTYSDHGFGDFLIFPKYNVLSHESEHHRDDITIGLGYKIPLGSYQDSTGYIEPFSGHVFYVVNPTSIQLSSGAQDIVFNALWSRHYLKPQLSIFINAFYIRKGYNPNGEKLGDYSSVALFFTKTLFSTVGIGLQARYEEVERMKINESVLLFGRPSNYYPEATGYRKVFLTPQITYTTGPISIFGSYDIPVYQYLNTSPYYTQAGSEFQATAGISYRFAISSKS
ncbi:MAG TPA: hypothetical protein VJ508_15040, partial [Saprospiraceae bacterium]|nr:hypothetical protein [Saprospiraceae bacterium]